MLHLCWLNPWGWEMAMFYSIQSQTWQSCGSCAWIKPYLGTPSFEVPQSWPSHGQCDGYSMWQGLICQNCCSNRGSIFAGPRKIPRYSGILWGDGKIGQWFQTRSLVVEYVLHFRMVQVRVCDDCCFRSMFWGAEMAACHLCCGACGPAKPSSSGVLNLSSN